MPTRFSAQPRCRAPSPGGCAPRARAGPSNGVDVEKGPESAGAGGARPGRLRQGTDLGAAARTCAHAHDRSNDAAAAAPAPRAHRLTCPTACCQHAIASIAPAQACSTWRRRASAARCTAVTASPRRAARSHSLSRRCKSPPLQTSASAAATMLTSTCCRRRRWQPSLAPLSTGARSQAARAWPASRQAGALLRAACRRWQQPCARRRPHAHRLCSHAAAPQRPAAACGRACADAAAPPACAVSNRHHANCDRSRRCESSMGSTG